MTEEEEVFIAMAARPENTHCTMCRHYGWEGKSTRPISDAPRYCGMAHWESWVATWRTPNPAWDTDEYIRIYQEWRDTILRARTCIDFEP